MSHHPDHENEGQEKIKRLQFGHQFTASYKKHERQAIKHVFWNPNSKAYVSYNEKSLHVWSPKTEETLNQIMFSETTKSPGISWVCYSTKHWVSLVTKV